MSAISCPLQRCPQANFSDSKGEFRPRKRPRATIVQLSRELRSPPSLQTPHSAHSLAQSGLWQIFKVNLLTSGRLDKLLQKSMVRTEHCSHRKGGARGRGPRARTWTCSVLVLQAPMAQELCDLGQATSPLWAFSQTQVQESLWALQREF